MGYSRATLNSIALVTALSTFLLGTMARAWGADNSNAGTRSKLREALTFHASFDHGTDAEYAKGDPSIYTLTRRTPKPESQPGLLTDDKTRLAAGAGLAGGGALRFTDHRSPWLYYAAAKNLVYAKRDWSGSVSLWLKVDPETELAPGYCDPIQITPNQWNDAAFFVDFNKDGNPRDFRLGAFADLSVWNAANENVNDIPENRRPLLPVRHPPFSGDSWTHVVFTWEGFNTGQRDARAYLYLNGTPHGPLTGWNQTFTWPDDKDSRILIGLNYIGLFDELSCFNRALTAEEVRFLHQHPGLLSGKD